MKKANADGVSERGWFGPMIVVAAQQNGLQWEYKLRFHTSGAEDLYKDGDWIPRVNLKASSEAQPREP
jgi:hypothetical protein